ncbi:MAG: flagellar export chaperone FliS [Bacillota bacterium]|nr:flagellar export chaperone FliS [Bacillota bacterium]
MSAPRVQDGTRYYREMQVQTASPAKLVWLMLDGAARFTAQAQKAVEAGDLEGAHRNIVRVQDIVDELDCALDMRAGEVARALEKVYAFARSRLVEANLRKDPQLLGVLRGMFEELRTAWEQAMRAAPARTV